MKISRKSIFDLAWSLFKAEIFTNFSDALKCAWLQSKNVANLKEGRTNFVFRKKDGSIRQAEGTLDQSLYNANFKGNDRPLPIGVARYYDLAKEAWRSYRIENLLRIAA